MDMFACSKVKIYFLLMFDTAVYAAEINEMGCYA